MHRNWAKANITLLKEESTELKLAQKNILEIAQNSGDLCKKIINGHSVNFEAAHGEIEGWKNVTKSVSETLDNLNTGLIYDKEVNKLESYRVKSHLMESRETNLKNLVKVQVKAINDEVTLQNKQEMETVLEDITKNSLVNMTETKEIPEQLEELMKLGGSYVPYLKNNEKSLGRNIKEELAKVLDVSYGMKGHKLQLFRGKHLASDIKSFIGNPDLSEEDYSYLIALLEGLENTIQECWTEYTPGKFAKGGKFFKEAFELKGKIVLESDKNVGYGLYTIDQILSLYEKTNLEQGFSKTELTNEEYLRRIAKQKAVLLPVIPEKIHNMLSQEQKEALNSNEGEIGFLRILPKIHKVESPSFWNFQDLTCRTIKTSNSDPVNGVAAVLGEATKPLVKAIIQYLEVRVGFSPAVESGDEAFYQMAGNDFIFEWSETLNSQGDIRNLFPSLKYPFVKEAYKTAFRIARMDQESSQFTLNCLFVVMANNVFRQPTGIYSSGNSEKDEEINGFAIGCKAASPASNLTLLVHEIKILSELERLNLLKNVKIYKRYMDDIKLILIGEKKEMLQALFIISTGYPDCLLVKMQVTYGVNQFLDMKSFIYPPRSRLQIMLLRKKNNSYGITRGDSNTSAKIKGTAMFSYAYRMERRTNTERDRKHQFEVNSLIFRQKGHSKGAFESRIKIVNNKRRRRGSQNNKKVSDGCSKRYGGIITFDQETSSHQHIQKLIKRANLPPQLRPPMLGPGKKLKQYIFTKREFEDKVKKHIESSRESGETSG